LKPEGRSGDSAAGFVAYASALSLLLGTSAIVYGNDWQSLGAFAYHPPLQTLAIGAFAYAILTLQPTSQPATKAAGLNLHQLVIVLLGMPALVLGTASIVYKKWPHYSLDYTLSWHGTFGWLSILWFIFQIIGGGGSVWFNGVAFGGGAKAKAIWKYHRASGYVLFPLLLWTAHIGGAYSKWVVAHTSYIARVAVFTVAPAALLIAVYSRARASKMQF